MEEKEQIKRSVSITDVVSMYVDLKPAGRYLKALCPFHTEKTPSFYVTPEKDSFSCYGCNKFGDIFTFIQEIENLSFVDAMNFLVDKFNIPIEKTKFTSHVKKDDYAGINEMALKYFRDNLSDTPEGKHAAQYLKKRGISDNTVDEFSLGYAENKWDGLSNFLKKKGVSPEKAVELGLLIKNDSGRIYDRFRGRVMFPIFSESGTPIAFGGRTLFDEPSKYLNSPDTPLYKKSKNLYGFNITKSAIREKKYAVLVEGYFDAVSLYQHGIKNVAASLGTALTENQIYLLKRFSDKIYIFYDSDKAGISAAVRGIEKMFEQNNNPFIISVEGTGAKDPDDYIREHGLQGFNTLVENATSGFQFLVDKISLKYDLNVPERKVEAVNSIMGFIGKFGDPIVRTDYARMAAAYFKIDEDMLKFKKQAGSKTVNGGNGKKLSVNLSEHIFLTALLTRPAFIGELKELITEDILSVMASKNIVRSLQRHFNPDTGGIDNFSALSEGLSDAEIVLFRDLYEKATHSEASETVLAEQIETAYLEFHEMLKGRKNKRSKQEIKIAEQQGNEDQLHQVLAEELKSIEIRKVELRQNRIKQGKLNNEQSKNIGGAVVKDHQ